MPKKPPAKPKLTKKLVAFPDDWLSRIEAVRGKQSFSDFIRAAVRARLGEAVLSEPAAVGRPKLDE